MGRLAPLRETAPLAARAAAITRESAEETALALAGAALSLAHESARPRVSAKDAASAAETARFLADEFAAPHSVAALARDAGLTPFRFLRAFKAAVGATPHQFLLRARLREAARLLLDTERAVTDIAYASGFEDLSNFTRTFRAEFGQSPRAWRASRGKIAARR